MSIRVTQGTIRADSLRGLQSSLARVQNLQAQLSSGKQIAVQLRRPPRVREGTEPGLQAGWLTPLDR